MPASIGTAVLGVLLLLSSTVNEVNAAANNSHKRLWVIVNRRHRTFQALKRITRRAGP